MSVGHPRSIDQSWCPSGCHATARPQCCALPPRHARLPLARGMQIPQCRRGKYSNWRAENSQWQFYPKKEVHPSAKCIFEGAWHYPGLSSHLPATKARGEEREAVVYQMHLTGARLANCSTESTLCRCGPGWAMRNNQTQLHYGYSIT